MVSPNSGSHACRSASEFDEISSQICSPYMYSYMKVTFGNDTERLYMKLYISFFLLRYALVEDEQSPNLSMVFTSGLMRR